MTKKKTNLYLDEKLVKKAKKLGINISRTCEITLRAIVEKNGKLLQENDETLKKSIREIMDEKVEKRLEMIRERFSDTMIVPRRVIDSALFTSKEVEKIEETLKREGFEILD